MPNYLLRTILIGACFGTLNIATAHHAVSAAYEVESSGSIEGVVEEVFWANPHVHFYIRVTTEDPAGELWDLESSNLNTMTRNGWKRGKLKVGDLVTASGTLGRDGSRRMLLKEFVLTDGSTLP
jgi:hypothetical protein